MKFLYKTFFSDSQPFTTYFSQKSLFSLLSQWQFTLFKKRVRENIGSHLIFHGHNPETNASFSGVWPMLTTLTILLTPSAPALEALSLASGESLRFLVFKPWKWRDSDKRLDSRTSGDLDFSPASFLLRWVILGNGEKAHTSVGCLCTNHSASQLCQL